MEDHFISKILSAKVAVVFFVGGGGVSSDKILQNIDLRNILKRVFSYNFSVFEKRLLKIK